MKRVREGLVPYRLKAWERGTSIVTTTNEQFTSYSDTEIASLWKFSDQITVKRFAFTSGRITSYARKPFLREYEQ